MIAPATTDPVLPLPTARQEFALSWRIVVGALVGVAFGVNGISYAAFGVMVDPLAAAFGTPVSRINLWVTCWSFGNVAAAPVIGALADRFGARRVILTALPIFILSLILEGSIGPHLWMLYTLAAIVGSVGTGSGPITYSRVVNTWFDAGRGAALGIMSAGIGLCYLLGPRLVQALVDAKGWRAGFFGLAAAHLLAFPLIIGWVRERRETVVRASRPVEVGFTVRQTLRLPVFWYATVAFFLYGLCAGGVTVNLVPFMTASGLTRASAASYMGLLGIFSVTGRVATGFIIDRLPVGLVCGVILVLEGLAFATFGLYGTGAVGLTLAVTGFAFGGEVSCMSYAIVRYFGVRHYGAINGLFAIVVGIAVGLGPPLIGYLHEASGGYRVPFLTGAAMAVASAIFFAVLASFPYFKAEPLAVKPATAGFA